jgi:hypothetical protein
MITRASWAKPLAKKQKALGTNKNGAMLLRF